MDFSLGRDGFSIDGNQDGSKRPSFNLVVDCGLEVLEPSPTSALEIFRGRGDDDGRGRPPEATSVFFSKRVSYGFNAFEADGVS